LRNPSITVSTAWAAFTREISDVSATLLTMSALIMAADYNLFRMSDSQRHRIDNWLKHVCLFKHRTEATDACRGGRVKVNGQRVKPAAPVREEDVIEFYSGETFRRVVVKGVPETQQAKELARTMYADETPVQPKFDTGGAVHRERGAGRPTKRERREAERFKNVPR
jgi:ribosome-associated heat shock protein Hsp15